MTVTGNTISWVDDLNIANMYVIGPPAPTGAFSTVAFGSEGAIQDLSLSSEPVGVTFDDPNWLTLPTPDAGLEHHVDIHLRGHRRPSGVRRRGCSEPNVYAARRRCYAWAIQPGE